MDINEEQNMYLDPSKAKPCYVANITAEHSIWQSENPFTTAFPVLAMQLCATTIVSALARLFLRPLGVPRFVSDVLSGIIIGPSFLGRHEPINTMFVLRTQITTETVAIWALSCHLFLVGLKMDMASVFSAGVKSIYFAGIGVIIPFLIGIGLYFVLNTSNAQPTSDWAGPLFFASVLVITSYPVMARILYDSRIIQTDIGRMAMSTAMVGELVSWILLLAIIPGRSSQMIDVAIAVLTSSAFVGFCVYVIRPFVALVIRKTAPTNHFNDYYLCSVLVSMSFFALVTDCLGTTSLVGCFVFGIIFPNKVLAALLLEKFDDFVASYLMPLFFAISGQAVDLGSVENWGKAIAVIIASALAKIWSALIAAYFNNLRMKDGLALGVLTNTKGILAIVILRIGFHSKKLSKQHDTVMMLAILLSTAIITPIISYMYNTSRQLTQYKRRTIKKAASSGEFRILACLQESRNVSGIINLIDTSNPTKKSPVSLFALHLIEITGRAAPMLVVHNIGAAASSFHKHRDFKSEQVVTAFEAYQNMNDFISVQPLTSYSIQATIHEDVRNLAIDRQVSLLILPFHKLPSLEGGLEKEGNNTFRSVNINVLVDAPCSVGIFVDKGFGTVTKGESNLAMKKVCMFFIGGRDDREGLAYAWRMAGSDWVRLTVIRFVLGDNVEEIEWIDLPADVQKHQLLTSATYVERQTRLDDEYINEFRLKTAGDESVIYEEKVVNNDEETVAAIKEMHHDFDLYILGKGDGIISPLTAPMIDWCEFPELGAIGDLMTTSSFSHGSILVVRQYVDSENVEDTETEEGSSRVARSEENFGSWRQPQEHNLENDENEKELEDDKELEDKPFAKQKESNTKQQVDF